MKHRGQECVCKGEPVWMVMPLPALLAFTTFPFSRNSLISSSESFSRFGTGSAARSDTWASTERACQANTHTRANDFQRR